MTLIGRLLAIAVAAVASSVVVVGTAPAASAEEVSELRVAAVVAPDTSMTVTETITYDFWPNPRHGIVRDIPVHDDLVSGERRYYGVDVTSVRMDGAPVPYESSTAGGYLRLGIGDPDEFVTGRHEYVIEYRLTGALRAVTAQSAARFGGEAGDAELYWDLVGSGWEVPIATARATVRGPADVRAVACFAGPYGSTRTCRTTVSGAAVDFGPVRLPVGSSLTGAAAWSASAFTVPIMQNVQPGPRASALRGAVVGGLVGLGVMAAMVAIALVRRRTDAGVRMAGAPVMVGPPCGLAPAEMVAALEGVGSTSTALMATYLDLAARGRLTVDVDHGAVVLTRRDRGRDELRLWETTLLEATFGTRGTAVLDDIDPHLQGAWTGIGIGLVDAAEDGGYRNPDSGRADRRWWWPGLAGAGLAVVSAVWLFFAELAPVPAAGLSLGLCLVVGAVVAAIITPATQTATSARFRSEVAGLRKVLGTDPAAGRRLFAQQSGLAPAAILATMLPYAVALGLQDAWVSAFPDLRADDMSGTGLQVVAAVLVGAIVISATSAGPSVGKAAADETSSAEPSARGSGLDGDGFAGGGGGGGGGGSW